MNTLCRAWDTKDHKYLYCEKQDFICTTHSTGLGVTLPYHKDDAPHFDEDCIDWADADLLMGRYKLEFYTGMEDNNGDKIYENDIVRCWDEHIGCVYFDEVLLQWRVKFQDGDDEDLSSCEPVIVSSMRYQKKENQWCI